MSDGAYDSTEDTKDHILRVRELLNKAEADLYERGVRHDWSKLRPPEKGAFDLLTPRLKDLTYGSDEYRATLRELKPALDHHYFLNPHHPEFYATDFAGRRNEREVEDGTAVSRMSLLDILEMLMDWKAASERHADGSILKSIEHNAKRFGLGDQLKQILFNTVREMGWPR